MPAIHVTLGAMFAGKSTALLRAVRTAWLRGGRPLVINHSLDTRTSGEAVRSHTGDTIACVKSDELMPLLSKMSSRMTTEDTSCNVIVDGVSVTFECENGRNCKVLVSDVEGKRTWVFRGDNPCAVLDDAARVVDLSSDSLLRLLSADFQYRIQAHTLTSYDCVFVDEGQFFPDLFEFSRKCAEEYKCDVHVFGLDGDYRRTKFGQILDLIPICDSVEKLVSVCGVCKDRPGLFSHRLTADAGQVLVGKNEYVQACRECFLKNPPESI